MPPATGCHPFFIKNIVVSFSPPTHLISGITFDQIFEYPDTIIGAVINVRSVKQEEPFTLHVSMNKFTEGTLDDPER
jgi:hypothetical protein